MLPNWPWCEVFILSVDGMSTQALSRCARGHVTIGLVRELDYFLLATTRQIGAFNDVLFKLFPWEGSLRRNERSSDNNVGV